MSNIRAVLGARRESIEALADAVDIKQSTMKRRLLGQSPLTLEEIEKIASHFEVSASDLISPSIANAVKSVSPALADGGVK